MSNIVYLKSFRINKKYMMFIQFFKYKLLKFAVIKESYLEQFCQKNRLFMLSTLSVVLVYFQSSCLSTLFLTYVFVLFTWESGMV